MHIFLFPVLPLGPQIRDGCPSCYLEALRLYTRFLGIEEMISCLLHRPAVCCFRFLYSSSHLTGPLGRGCLLDGVGEKTVLLAKMVDAPLPACLDAVKTDKIKHPPGPSAFIPVEKPTMVAELAGGPPCLRRRLPDVVLYGLNRHIAWQPTSLCFRFNQAPVSAETQTITFANVRPDTCTAFHSSWIIVYLLQLHRMRRRKMFCPLSAACR